MSSDLRITDYEVIKQITLQTVSTHAGEKIWDCLEFTHKQYYFVLNSCIRKVKVILLAEIYLDNCLSFYLLFIFKSTKPVRHLQS